MASERKKQGARLLELEESSIVLERELKELEEIKVPKNPRPRVVVVPQYDVWKFKWGWSIGIFIAGISLGVMIVTLSKSRHEEMSVAPVLAEQVSVSRHSPVAEPVPTPIEGEVGTSPVSPIESAVIQKKENPSGSSSSDSLFRRIHDLRERIKKGE